MGIDIGLYRIRIGLFSMPIKRGCKLSVLRVSRQSVSVCLRLAVFLSVLTILGGDVELNPGPPRQQKQRLLSFAEVSAAETPPPPPSQSTTRARANKANDSEVMAFLREMKSEMKTDLSSINSKMEDISNTVNVLKSENELLRQENISIKQELSSMSVKLDKLEGHSRRNNLRFLGIKGRISESWEESEQKVREFISDTLGLTDLANVEIERAHRVGSRRSDSCPIIAKFSKYKDRESILRAARQNLNSQSQYSVREDYTERVQLHRRELTKTLVEARNQGKYASLRFDKLIVDGDTFKYNDANGTVERIGSSRSRGRVGGNSGSQRLGASRGNDDAGTRASQGQDYYISSNSSSRGRVNNRHLASEAGSQPIDSQDQEADDSDRDP